MEICIGLPSFTQKPAKESSDSTALRLTIPLNWPQSGAETTANLRECDKIRRLALRLMCHVIPLDGMRLRQVAVHQIFQTLLPPGTRVGVDILRNDLVKDRAEV